MTVSPLVPALLLMWFAADATAQEWRLVLPFARQGHALAHDEARTPWRTTPASWWRPRRW